MNIASIVAIVDMLLGIFEIVSYVLLVWWSVGIFKSFPLEKHFKNVRFYHILIPALALSGFAFRPVSVIWNLIRKFPLDYSKAWIPSLLKFFEGFGFLAFLFYVAKKSSQPKKYGVKERVNELVGKKKKLQFKWEYFAVVLAFAVLLFGVYYYLSSKGYILRFSFFKPEYLEYSQESPKISFSYPSRFTIDKDKENRFGKDYVVGIKLPSDPRVGCDIRQIKGKLNLSGELTTVTDNLAKQISQGSKNFEVLNSTFIEIDGEKAIKLNIQFTGPLEETMRTDQVFTTHGGSVYTIICGTTKDTYQYFEEDFDYFFENFGWE